MQLKTDAIIDIKTSSFVEYSPLFSGSPSVFMIQFRISEIRGEKMFSDLHPSISRLSIEFCRAEEQPLELLKEPCISSLPNMPASGSSWK